MAGPYHLENGLTITSGFNCKYFLAGIIKPGPLVEAPRQLERSWHMAEAAEDEEFKAWMAKQGDPEQAPIFPAPMIRKFGGAPPKGAQPAQRAGKATVKLSAQLPRSEVPEHSKAAPAAVPPAPSKKLPLIAKASAPPAPSAKLVPRPPSEPPPASSMRKGEEDGEDEEELAPPEVVGGPRVHGVMPKASIKPYRARFSGHISFLGLLGSSQPHACNHVDGGGI